MPATGRQLLFCRVDDAVHVTGHDAYKRLVACLGVAHANELEQRSDVVLVAVGVLAARFLSSTGRL
jgi:hypothetical protein